MTINQFFTVVFSRKRLFLMVFLSVVLLVTVVSLLLPKHFTAEADIAIDSGNQDPVGALSSTSQVFQEQNYLGTQAGILSSHNTAKKVVESLKLSSSEDIQAQYQSIAGQDMTGIDDWLAEILLKDFTVDLSKDSNIIHLTFKSKDPYFSAAVTNGFIDAYKRMVIESRGGLASQNEVFFKGQLEKLKDTLESKQKLLADYQKDHGIVVSSDARIDLESQKMMALATQVDSAQADYISARSQLNENGKLNVDPLSNPLIQQLTAQLVDLEKNRSDLAQREGVNHPGYRQVEAQIIAVKSQLQGLKKQYDSIQASTVSNMEKRLNDQKQALALQKQRVLDMKDQQAQLDILQRGVDNAQHNYDLVMQKWSESLLQASANLTNITILQSAVPPWRASSPKLFLNIFISLFIGFFFAATLNYLLDLKDKRVRCIDDIEVLCQVPVLVRMNQRQAPHRLGWRGRTELIKGA